MSSLFCIVANKVLPDYYVRKVVMFMFFLMGPYCLWGHRISHIYMLWVTRTTFMVLCFLVWVAHCWVLHVVQVSATSCCTTKGHPVVLSSENGLNFQGNAVVPLHGCHICPPLEFFWRHNSQKFLSEKQMLDTIISAVSYTHLTLPTTSRV